MKLIFIILVFAPDFIAGCQLKRDWWELATIYQIYPASFYDTNGDGLGDIKGITAKLGYIKSLNMDSIWMSPIFLTPFKAFGYDISDYKAIDPMFGTMDDFDELVREAAKLNIKIILDIVPNHTSEQHPWFLKSIDRDPEYENYFVWHPGKIDPESGERRPPSNWINLSRMSMWEWNDKRGEYFLNQFHPNIPDLNFREEKVKLEFNSIFEFWMNKGVYGFRIDAIGHLIEAYDNETDTYSDEPKSGNTEDELSYEYHDHIYTKDQDETFQVIYDFRAYIDSYKQRNPSSQSRLLLSESYTSLENLRRYYGDETRDGSHVPFHFNVMWETSPTSNAHDLKTIVDSFNAKIPIKYIPNWVLGNHDQSRIATRAGVDKIDIMNVYQMTLPGISISYNGEEIGMVDTCLEYPSESDPILCANQDDFNHFRDDFSRTPMQWDNAKNAGFSSADTTWRPVNPNYPGLNVNIQEDNADSHLNIFRSLTKIRKQYEALRSGFLEMKVLTDNVLGYVRYLDGINNIVILLNTGSNVEKFDLKDQLENLKTNMVVVLSGEKSVHQKGDPIMLGEVTLGPYQFLILEERPNILPFYKYKVK